MSARGARVRLYEEMFQLGPCRYWHQQVAVCQAHVPPEIEVYATEVSEGHAKRQVASGKHGGIRPKTSGRMINFGQLQPRDRVADAGMLQSD